MEFDPLSPKVLGSAIEVHRTLGPGLLETVYEKALAQELTDAGLQVDAQVQLPVIYKERDLGCGFRIDLLVENSVVVELKTVDPLAPIHEAQLLTYLKLSGHRIGLRSTSTFRCSNTASNAWSIDQNLRAFAPS